MSEKHTVLVVDDERDLADLYAAWLESEYDVRTAYGGDEALDRVDDGVDVALVDRLMPDRSGDEVLSAIREKEYGVKVAMVTAVEPDFDIIEMGFDDYVVKPVRREELLEVVNGLLQRGTYDTQLQEYFALVSKRAALEAEKTDRELAESTAYDDLNERIETLRERLDETTAKMDDEDFEAVLRQLE